MRALKCTTMQNHLRATLWKHPVGDIFFEMRYEQNRHLKSQASALRILLADNILFDGR